MYLPSNLNLSLQDETKSGVTTSQNFSKTSGFNVSNTSVVLGGTFLLLGLLIYKKVK